MFRSSRVALSLIWSIAARTAPIALATLTAVTAIGCKDENQPEYWIEKLDDASWRARSVKRLEQFFEDILTKSGDIKSAEVQAFINKTVEPLTKTYLTGAEALDSKTRVALIKLLASYRDKRTEPALKKAFEDFAKNPASSKEEQDIKWASRAAGDLKLDSLAGPILDTFVKLRASSMLGGIVYRDLNDAMLDMPQKSWVAPLIAKLDADMEPPQAGKKELIDPYRDQQFWQVTAAELLGKIADPAAVVPLIKVLLDPAKVDIHATAITALIKIGKPSIDAAVKLLKGQDDKLIAYFNERAKKASGSEPKGKPYVQTAALILGTIGRSEGGPPLIEALGAKDLDDTTRAIIARELVKIPATAESKQAFMKAFESMPLDASIPPGQNAIQTLSESAGQFFDAGMVDWLLERVAKSAKVKGGSDDDKKQFQSAVLVTALKLAKPEQLPAIKKAVDKFGTKLEKDLYTLSEAQLKACADRAPCYIEAIKKGENQERSKQFAAIKAGYMIGILGNDATRDQLVASLDSLDNALVRFMAAQVIDKLTPKGSASVTEKLRSIIERNAKSPDKNKAAGDAPLKQVMYRVESRGK